MLILISPAKNQDFKSPLPVHLQNIVTCSLPYFQDEVQELVRIMKWQNAADLQKMMAISEKLAEQNVARYGEFSSEYTAANSKAALFAFNGEVYRGLDANGFDAKDITYAQEHLRILSGLYGFLRPLDLMQPYRLEMGIPLKNNKGGNLYQFWQDKLTNFLNTELSIFKKPYLINLASEEYSKAINFNQVQANVIHVQFKEFKDNQYKIIGTLAKKARGEMTKYIIKNKIMNPSKIKLFNENKYTFNANISSSSEWIFSR